MAGNADIVLTLFLVFTAAAVFATAMLWARQALIIGYILAGVVIGPWGIGLIADTRIIGNLAETGIIFLLFLLGLDLTPQKLIHLFKQTTRITLSTSALFCLAGFGLALAFGFSSAAALLTGVACMFSSTIIGIKLLPTTVLHHRHTGEVIISVLLLQDLIAIAVMVGIQALTQAESGRSQLLLPLLSLPLLAILAWAFERYLLLRLLTRFDQVQEFVFLLTLAWCIGMAWLAHTLGLSYEMGAFMAGVIMASSPIAQFIALRLKPLRDFFLVLFFVALGAGLNLDLVPQVLWPALALALLMLTLKPLAYRFALRGVAKTTPLAWETGWRLGQMSEFSLLITFLALGLPGVSETTLLLIQLATVLTFIGSSAIVVLNYPTPVAVDPSLRRD